jgi:hypothetical protein
MGRVDLGVLLLKQIPRINLRDLIFPRIGHTLIIGVNNHDSVIIVTTRLWRLLLFRGLWFLVRKRASSPPNDLQSIFIAIDNNRGSIRGNNWVALGGINAVRELVAAIGKSKLVQGTSISRKLQSIP